jgi:hypothetical protein
MFYSMWPIFIEQEQMNLKVIDWKSVFNLLQKTGEVKTISCIFYDFMEDMPPSTARICPVIQEASSDNKNEAILAMSAGFPILFRG